MKIIVVYGCSSNEKENGILHAQSIARQMSNLGHQATVIDVSMVAPVRSPREGNHYQLQEHILCEFWMLLQDADVLVFTLGHNLSHVPDFMHNIIQTIRKRKNRKSLSATSFKSIKVDAFQDEIDNMYDKWPELSPCQSQLNNLPLSQQIKETKKTRDNILLGSDSGSTVTKLIRLKQYQIWNHNGINYGLVTLSANCRTAAVELWSVLHTLDSVYLSNVFQYGIPNKYPCDHSVETAGPCVG